MGYSKETPWALYLGFALTLQPIIKKIKDGVLGVKLNAWYLDDGTLCGSPRELAAALKIMEDEGPLRGIHLNRAKSLLYVPPNCTSTPKPLLQNIPLIMGGYFLLGSPVGPAALCEAFHLQRVVKVKVCLAMLPNLEDSQMETILLRSCLSLPKVSSLRTCPPGHIKMPQWPLTTPCPT